MLFREVADILSGLVTMYADLACAAEIFVQAEELYAAMPVNGLPEHLKVCLGTV